MSGADIYGRLCAQYKGSVLSQSGVFEWILKFKEGSTIVPAIIKKQDALPRPRLDDEVERAFELIRGNRRRVTVDDVTDHL